MEIILFVIGVVIPCASEKVSTVPGDNSQYVEGKSRYIWMPDGQGDPVLVDLHEPIDEAVLSSRSETSNKYWLYTRNNPTTAQVLIYEDASSVLRSNYVASRPLMVIVHGLYNSGLSPMNPLITSAYLDVLDGNALVVDWSTLANTNYVYAALAVGDVGRSLGDFLAWLLDTTGGDWDRVHLVGFSLGAHVVGFAGRSLGGRPGRVTGLDPAGPGWRVNKNALGTDAGQYVEAIHTDSGILGILHPVGHADMYPNRGLTPQPGCWLSICSHSRATQLFASSIRHPDDFIGSQCSNIFLVLMGMCSGDKMSMGNTNESKRGTGLFALATGSIWPFIPQ